MGRIDLHSIICTSILSIVVNLTFFCKHENFNLWCSFDIHSFFIDIKLGNCSTIVSIYSMKIIMEKTGRWTRLVFQWSMDLGIDMSAIRNFTTDLTKPHNELQSETETRRDISPSNSENERTISGPTKINYFGRQQLSQLLFSKWLSIIK